MGSRRRRPRRRPLPGEGSDRLGSNFDRGLTAGEPDEVINLSINTGILGEYVNELTALAVEYRRNLERGHLQLREIVSMYLGLPHVRAFWPMTSYDESQDVYDVSGQGRTLVSNGVLGFGLAAGMDLLAPVVSFGVSNSNRYFSRADENGLNWTGLNNFMGVGWVRPRWGSVVGFAPVFSKGDENVASEYYVLIDESTYRLKVGAGDEDHTAPLSRALTPAVWNFIAAGYDAGTDTFVLYINGWYSSVQANSPTLTATTDPFYIGRHDNGATVRRWRGEMSMMGFFADVLGQEHLDILYEGSRFLFGQ